MSQMIDTFRAARRAATPLLCIRTPDPGATVRTIKDALNGTAPPILQWDIMNGIKAVNKEADGICETGEMTVPLVPTLGRIFPDLPERTIVFMFNAHRYVNEAAIAQAIWNLRDIFKLKRCSLVLLAPEITLPLELQQDVVMLDEPRPTVDDLKTVVKDIYKSASLPEPDESALTLETDALLGLPHFPAEQAAAMSITREGMDRRALWDRKCSTIEQTRGLAVYRGDEKFADIGGCANAKEYMKLVIGSREAPRVYVFMDEIDKQFAGAGTDTSGVASKAHGTILTWMQDHNATGSLYIGPPGAAKTMLAKATGNESGKILITMDMATAESSLVGESNANLRAMLSTIEAVGQGQYYFIATCNSLANISPELKRRFDDSTFYFDLPTAEERAAIWPIYFQKFNLKPVKITFDNDWTGAEIRSCCKKAWRFGCSVEKAAQYIVPVAKSAADKIKALREMAQGRFISANYPGTYDQNRKSAVARGRSLEL